MSQDGILYILRGHRLYISRKYCRVDFVIANSSDHDDMPYFSAFYLGLHYLSKYPFRCLQYSKSENCVISVSILCLFKFCILGK